ncbi:MAG: hypothetical protein AAF902_17155 [Chloroflexota bacterium]
MANLERDADVRLRLHVSLTAASVSLGIGRKACSAAVPFTQIVFFANG